MGSRRSGRGEWNQRLDERGRNMGQEERIKDQKDQPRNLFGKIEI